MFLGVPLVCLSAIHCTLTAISHDVISPYLVEGFECNLAQIFITLVDTAE